MAKTTHTAKYKRLIDTLRAARREQGMTQLELAKRLKRPQSYVAKYEQRRLDIVEFIAIADALGISAVTALKTVDLI